MVLLATAACKLAGIERGTPLKGTLAGGGDACRYVTLRSLKSGGGGGTIEDLSFWGSVSCATGCSSPRLACVSGGASSAFNDGARGGRGGRREVETGGVALLPGRLVGVFSSDAGVRIRLGSRPLEMCPAWC